MLVGAAECRCSGESVVVKAVRVDTLDPDERQMALQEAQTLSHLRHTNIIRYHDVRYNNGTQLMLSLLLPPACSWYSIWCHCIRSSEGAILCRAICFVHHHGKCSGR